jgi:DNA-binding PadR family transcriptional regulator
MEVIMENKIQFVILGLLLDNPMNGYQIKKTLDLSTSNFQKISFGNIYPTLKKLEKHNYIESIEDVSNNKKQFIYKINELGYKHFINWLLTPLDELQFGHNHLLHLFFFKHLNQDEKKTKAKYFIDFYNMEIQKLIKLKDQVCHLADSYQLDTLEYGLKIYHLNIEFYTKYLIEGDFNHE